MKHKYKPILLPNVYSMTIDTDLHQHKHEITLETNYIVPMFEKGTPYRQSYAVEMSEPTDGLLRRVEFSEITPLYQTIDATPMETRYISKMRVRKMIFMKVENGK